MLEPAVQSGDWVQNRVVINDVKHMYPSIFQDELTRSHVTVSFKAVPRKTTTIRQIIRNVKEEGGEGITLREFGGDMEIFMDELEYLEKDLPEKAETKVMEYKDIDDWVRKEKFIFGDKKNQLVWPVNASAVYEVKSGGAELRYSFDIEIKESGQRVQSLKLRDTVSQTWEYGENLRMRLPDGKEQTSDYHPSSAVRKLFEQKAEERPTAQDFRPQVLNTITSAIMENPKLKKASLLGGKPGRHPNPVRLH